MKAEFMGKTITSVKGGFVIFDTILHRVYPKTVEGLLELTKDIEEAHTWKK